MATYIPGEIQSGGSTYSIDQGRRITEVREKIFWLDGMKNSLALLTNRVSRKRVEDHKYQWIEQRRVPHLTGINNAGGYSAGATAFVVDDASVFSAKMTAKNQRTREVYFITAVNYGTNTITVTRTWGGTAAAPLLDNDPLTALGPNFEQNSDPGTSNILLPTQPYNVTDIARTPFGLSRTVRQTRQHGGMSELERQRRLYGIAHAEEIESKMFRGERAETSDTNGNLIYSAGGLEEVISTNLTDFGNHLTHPELEYWLAKVYLRGSSGKVAFCPHKVMSAVALLAKDALETAPSSETFGLSVKRWLSPHGPLILVPHRGAAFEGGYYERDLFVVDIANVGYVFIQDTIRQDISPIGRDGTKEEYLTEWGFERILEETHGLARNAV